MWYRTEFSTKKKKKRRLSCQAIIQVNTIHNPYILCKLVNGYRDRAINQRE